LVWEQSYALFNIPQAIRRASFDNSLVDCSALIQEGLMSGYAIQSTSAVSYLFVDGGCVRAELNAISKHYLGGPGRVKLSWTSIQQDYTKVFYYDALPTRNEGETDLEYQERNAVMLAAHQELRQLDRFHVYEGDVRRARGRQERAQQKKVDVMIAVDMLLHTFRRNMQSATLIASDLDFAPLLYALTREGMFLTLWYPPSATSAELQSAADSRRRFTANELAGALIDEHGRPLLPTWQSGMVHYRQNPVVQTWEAENKQSVIISGGGNHFLCEVTDVNGGTIAYAAHHNLRTLLLTGEERYRIVLPDEAYDQIGGRPA
jgi:uncharacterized LabA/DUF88 family protein